MARTVTRSLTPIRVLGALILALDGSQAAAQKPAVTRERQEFARWLAEAPTSPLAAVGLAAIGAGLRLGPADADLPLAGLGEHRVKERGGRITLEGAGSARPLPRGRAVSVGRYTLVAGGPAGRSTLTAFGPPKSTAAKPASWYEYRDRANVTVTLTPPAEPRTVRILSAEGVEVEAADAGTVAVPVGDTRAVLTVRRMPGATPEESELEVYFRDRTNGKGTYPAGRFVALIPTGDGRYRLDFNRARNPFCAYSSVYPCPVPWRGNSIDTPVEAGERYAGGGLDPGSVGEQ
jgi:hypothetical protein